MSDDSKVTHDESGDKTAVDRAIAREHKARQLEISGLLYGAPYDHAELEAALDARERDAALGYSEQDAQNDRGAAALCDEWQRIIGFRTELERRALEPVGVTDEDVIRGLALMAGRTLDDNEVRAWQQNERGEGRANRTAAAEELALFNEDLCKTLVHPERPTKNALAKLIERWGNCDAERLRFGPLSSDGRRRQAVAHAFRWTLPIVKELYNVHGWTVRPGASLPTIDIRAELASRIGERSESAIDLAALCVYMMQQDVCDSPPRPPSSSRPWPERWPLGWPHPRSAEMAAEDEQWRIDSLLSALHCRQVREVDVDAAGPAKACHRLLEHTSGLSARTISNYIR